MEEIKRISRDLVAHGAIIDYYQDTMQIPNGHVARCCAWTDEKATGSPT